MAPLPAVVAVLLAASPPSVDATAASRSADSSPPDAPAETLSPAAKVAAVALVTPVVVVVGASTTAALGFFPNGGLGPQLAGQVLVEHIVKADPLMPPTQRHALALLADLALVVPVGAVAGASAMVFAATAESAFDDGDGTVELERFTFTGAATALATAAGLLTTSYFFGELRRATRNDALAWFAAVSLGAVAGATTAGAVAGVEEALALADDGHAAVDERDDDDLAHRAVAAALAAAPGAVVGGALGAVVGAFAGGILGTIVAIPLAATSQAIGPAPALLVLMGAPVVGATVVGALGAAGFAAGAAAGVDHVAAPPRRVVWSMPVTVAGVTVAGLAAPLACVAVYAAAAPRMDGLSALRVALLPLALPVAVALITAPVDVLVAASLDGAE